MKHYLIVCIGMTDPEVVSGPFADNNELVDEARKLVAHEQYDLDEYGEDALFWLDIDEDGKPEIGSFSAGFMDEAREMASDIIESEQRVLEEITSGG
jgi:hypothetical protein